MEVELHPIEPRLQNGKHHAPAALPQGRDPVHIAQESRDPSGWVRYTDYAILASNTYETKKKKKKE